MLVLVVVLVLDLLGFPVETGHEYSGTISLYQRDGEITRILEHEDEQEHEHDLPNFGILGLTNMQSPTTPTAVPRM